MAAQNDALQVVLEGTFCIGLMHTGRGNAGDGARLLPRL